jgi:hypothetical protein
MSKEEVRLSTMVAQERWLEKIGSVDRPNYAEGKAAGRLEHELLANIRANICEWAVAKVYNQSWNMPWYPNSLHPKRKDIADCGSNIEVRSIRTQAAVPFWKKDKGKWIVGAKVLDTDYYTKVEVFGRIFADNFMTDEYYDSSISGWRVPIDSFTE